MLRLAIGRMGAVSCRHRREISGAIRQRDCRRGSQRCGRPSILCLIWRRMCGARRICAHRVRRDRISCARHRTPSNDWEVLLVIDGGLWVQTLLRSYLLQSGVGGGLLQVCRRGMGSRVVADQMKMLASGSGDTEGLLHQTVRFISITIRAFVGSISAVLIAAPALWRLARSRYRALGNAATSTLALHLAISQKATGYPTGAP